MIKISCKKKKTLVKKFLKMAVKVAQRVKTMVTKLDELILLPGPGCKHSVQ